MNTETFIAHLPKPRQEIYRKLIEQAGRCADENPRAQEYVFVPGRIHPTWDDSEAVFWRAVGSLAPEVLGGTDELPIIVIGYDLMNRFSGRREPQGFLVTDRRLISSADISIFKQEEKTRQYPLFVGPAGIAVSAATITQNAISNYDWDFAESLIDKETVQWISLVLAQSLVVIMEIVQETGSALPSEIETAKDLRGRLSELGLLSIANFPDNPKRKKHFAKLGKKIPFGIDEEIILSFTDSTLAGPYGIVLTNKNMWSKDLWEEPVSTPIEKIEPDQVRISLDDDAQIIVAAGQVHTIPAYIDATQKDSLVTFVREWAAGKLS